MPVPETIVRVIGYGHNSSAQVVFDAFSIFPTLKLCFHAPSFAFVLFFTFIYLPLQLHISHLIFTYILTKDKSKGPCSQETSYFRSPLVTLAEARFGQENSVQGIITTIGGNT